MLEMVTTPLLPSDYLDLFSPLRAGADLRGRIEAVHPETPDAATIVIRPGRGWRGHTAGQYVRIGVDVDGVRLWRAYSLTSPADREDGRITITVKAIDCGNVRHHLGRRGKTGTPIPPHSSSVRSRRVRPSPSRRCNSSPVRRCASRNGTPLRTRASARSVA